MTELPNLPDERLTIAMVRKYVHDLGFTLRVCDGDHRLCPIGGTEAQAYCSDDLVLQPGFRMDRAALHTLRSLEPKFFNFTDSPRAVNFARNIRILDQKFSIFSV